jgi:hypothetical protein
MPYYNKIKYNSIIMPYKVVQKSARRYSVINPKTGKVHAKNTTLKRAKKQVRLLNAIDHGFKPLN